MLDALDILFVENDITANIDSDKVIDALYKHVVYY
jgi:hypothetical protein